MRRKILATIMLIILLSGNLLNVGSQVIALASTLPTQNSKTNNSNVEFNSYLEEGESHDKTFEVSKGGKLYINLKVKENGYLKDGVIEFQNSNFNLDSSQIESEYIQKIENGKIYLEQMQSGEECVIELPIEFAKSEKIDSDYFSKEVKTLFTADYINGNGNEKKIQKEVVNKIGWQVESEIEIEGKLNKYLPYHIGEEYGVIFQSKIDLGIKDNKAPIAKTNLEVEVPTINNQEAERVSVVLNSNKEDEVEEKNITTYNYEKENQKVMIETVREKDEEGKIDWEEGKDEYIVTSVYTGEEVYNYVNNKLKEAEAGKLTEEEIKEGQVNDKAITGNILATANIETYDGKSSTVEIGRKGSYVVEGPIGKITDINVESPKEISKGYLYANYDKEENKQETIYDITYITPIYDKVLNSSIEYQINNDKVEYEGELYSAENNIYVKQIKISKTNFIKLLGDSGSIKVSKKDGTVIGIIVSDETRAVINNLPEDALMNTFDDENGSYVLNIEKQKLSELLIETSTPKSEGRLVVTLTKAFSADNNYTKDQMKELTKIQTEVIERTGIDSKTITSDIKLTEVTNKAEININPESLSTVIVNKDVGIRAVLDTSSINYALYKNPTLKIRFPSYISDVKLNSKNILMNNGLKIKSVNVEKEDGVPVINIILEGTQSDYTLDAEYKGTIILLNADITVKTLTPSNENKIEMIYINENDVVKEKQGKVETKVNFVAPTGVVSANAIANYAENSKEVMSISDKTEEVQIETYSDKKVATVTGTVVNNYGNKITDLKILGRLPSKDNRKIDSEEEIGSTFDAVINSEIKVTGLENYKVYYSNKVDANSNLEDAENGWTEKFSKEAKSYMILADEGYEMNEQEVITFSYDIEVPANLSYNNSSYEMYKVYYTNTSEVGSLEETKESPVIALTTGEGPELDVKLESTADVIREGQTVKMNVTVTNTGDMAVTNAKLNIPKPEYAKFSVYTYNMGFSEQVADEKTIDIGTIKPGETITKSYYIKIDNSIPSPKTYKDSDGNIYIDDEDGTVKKLEDGKLPETEFTSKVTIIGDQMQNGIPSNEYKNTIKDGEIKLQLIGSIEDSTPLLKGQETKYRVNISYIGSESELKDITVNIPLLPGTNYKEATLEQENGVTSRNTISYDKNTHTLQVKIDTLTTTEQVIRITLEGKEFDGVSSMRAIAKSAEGEEHYSNTLEYESAKVKLEISELTTTPRYVKEGETITYKFDIKNIGDIIAENIKIEDVIPDEFLFTELSYTTDSGVQHITNISNNTARTVISQLPVGASASITIIVRAKVLNGEEDKQVKNTVKVSAQYFEEVQTNTVTNTIEYNEELHKEPSSNPNQGGTTTSPTTPKYKIAGTAWLDENKDGKRDNTEKLLSNIQVVLLNKVNNMVVNDINTNEPKRTTTSNNGTYEFANIMPGEYLVLFLYDASSYSLTKYKTEGIDEGLNSDVIDINTVFDGEKRVAGITNIVKITDSNVRDIDIGLYVAEKFDLRLDKYVSKITLTTPTIGTRVTPYNDEKLAKVEILGNNVNKSNIIVEYKIKVTNEGKIPGYARKLIDYLPEDAMFMSEVNSDWYLASNNQDVFNTSLANTIINPGESKEVTLVLSFNITDKNIGNIINNNAEIYESYNEEGREDLDSLAGNNISQEDDISKADIVLSVVTGKLVVGSILIVVILAVLAFGVYEIKRRVLTKKVN